MKVTYSWLKDYIDMKISPERVAHLLTMAGSEVTSIDKVKGDAVFELEITPNRTDCLSVVGIARELAAVTGKKLSVPSCVVRRASCVNAVPSYAKASEGERSTQYAVRISIEIKDRKLCPRYSGRMIEGIRVGASPKWIQERLKMVGLRPVNNIVDITNFCLFEMGQPMHAFDCDKIKGAKVIVRRAKEGEKITTIDGIERKLSGGMLVIADETRPIAIAGIMGGLDTEVCSSTKNILLESAYFDPVSVRLTSRRLGLGSESSYRFERSVDIESVVTASNRATLLINKFAGGRCGVLVDKGRKKYKSKEILYDVRKADNILGVNIPHPTTTSIFKALGFGVSGPKGNLKIKIPSFRQDLVSDIDLVEEVARIYGYDKIPSTIPKMVSQPARKEPVRIFQERIREFLIASGLSEVVTYSLISKNLLEQLSFEGRETIEVINPLSAEQEIMRPTILAGMLNVVLWNLNRKIEGLKIFELGNIYFREKGEFKESLNLAIAVTGALTGNWRDKRRMDFFDIKGVIEKFFYKLGIQNLIFSKEKVPHFSPTQSAALKVDGRKVGVMGKLDKGILNRFDIKQDVYAAEVCIDELIHFINLKKRFSPIPKFPSIKRDISIILNKDLSSTDIVSSIKKVGASLITGVEIFDEYYGEQIPEGKKGLSFSIIYQDRTKTLTDQEVDSLHSKVKEALAKKFSIHFR